MVHPYQDAGNLTDDVRKLIYFIMETSHLCRKNIPKSTPSVALSQSSDFNDQLQEHEEYEALEVLLLRSLLTF